MGNVDATGGNSSIPKNNVDAIHERKQQQMRVPAYVLGPPGYETVPLRSGALTCALCREICVVVVWQIRALGARSIFMWS